MVFEKKVLVFEKKVLVFEKKFLVLKRKFWFALVGHCRQIAGKEVLFIIGRGVSPFGTLLNIETFDYTAKLHYGRGLGLVSHKKRAKTV